MSKITGRFLLEINKLSKEGKEALIERLFPLHERIFHGVSKDSFSNYVVHSIAARSVIAIYHNDVGEDVGYCAMHFFEQKIHGNVTCVIRMESGLLQNYRGRNSNISFIISQLIRYRSSYPNRPLYYLGTLIHPSSYLLLVKYADCIWPRKENPSEQVVELLENMSLFFSLSPVDNKNPNIVHVGWCTKETNEERERLKKIDNEHIQEYLHLNPEYSKGYGLVTLASLSNRGIIIFLLRMFKYRFIKIFPINYGYS